MSAQELAARIEEVARAVLGEPNKRLSTKDELRFGSNGSLRVSIAGDHRGTWRDHETDAGGGVLDLIAHKQGGDRKSAAAWFSANFEEGPPQSREIVATYPYTDWAGELVFEVVRYAPKDFRQRRPDGKGGYTWKVAGLRPLIYNLPAVMDAITAGKSVFVVEGEKDADRLNALGLVATCNAGGAGKWKPEHADQLRGAQVIIVPDNDDAGHRHAEQVAQSLRECCADVRQVELGVADRKADVSDWLDAGGNTAQLVELAAAAPQWRPAFKPRFPLVWFGQEDAGPPMQWLVRGMLVEGGLSVFFGAPKETKTFCALDLALHAAHGRDWFGLRTRACGVAYICGEGAAGVRQRMKAWRKEREGDPAAPFALIPQSINLFDDPDELDRLIADLKGMADPMGRPVGLVVLDTLARMIGGGDEDRARDVNVVVRSADRIQRMTGAHVLVVHHSGKDKSKGMRGSNALLGAVDAAVEVSKDAESGLCEARVVAIKDGGEVGPFNYTLSQTAVGTDDEGEPILSCVIEPAGARQGGKQPHLSDAEGRALAVLRNLVGDNGDMPGHWRNVPLGTWRDTFGTNEAGEAEAIKKRFNRAKNALEDKGFIQVRGADVWLTEAVE